MSTDTEPELEVEVIPDEPEETEKPEVDYPWCSSPEEYRRTWIFELMSGHDLEGKILVSDMALIEKFLITGEAPPAESKPRTKLKVVE